MGNKKTPMSGWKMKTSAFLAAIGTSIIGLGQVVPNPKVSPWMMFIGVALDGLATAFGIWGAGHKMEKNTAIIMKEPKIPQPPTECDIK